MMHRNGMSTEAAMRLWSAYNKRLLDLLETKRFPLVNFDLLPGEYVDDSVRKLIDLGLDRAYADRAVDFFEDGLRHQYGPSLQAGTIPHEVELLYERLLCFV